MGRAGLPSWCALAKEGEMSRKILIMLSVLSLVLSGLGLGCAPYGPSTPRTYEGAAVGAGVGAAAGALLDGGNRWRGGVIGGALGAIAGGALTEIGARASREAAYANQPVAYQNQAGNQRVVAHPVGTTPGGNCRTIREEYYENGQLVKVRYPVVCD